MTVNPSMVVVARESRGWTQEDLSNAIGVAQGTVSKFEIGYRPMPDDVAARVASALRFHVSLLHVREPVHDLNSEMLFRKKSAARISVQRRVVAEANIRKLQVQRLCRTVNIVPDRAFPEMPLPEFESPEAAAGELRRIWQMPRGPVVNLTRYIESAGGIVLVMDFGTPQIDGLHFRVPGMHPIFFLNSESSAERHRFSLAHELAHAIMHPHPCDPDRDVEAEADAFASEFLMPKRDIRDDLKSFSIGTAARLKPVWKVSMQALIRRAHDVDAISQSSYRGLCQYISARQMRRSEPFAIEREEPELFERLVDAYLDHLRISRDNISEVLFVDPSRLGPMSSPPPLRFVSESLFDSQVMDVINGPEIAAPSNTVLRTSLQSGGSPLRLTQ